MYPTVDSGDSGGESRADSGVASEVKIVKIGGETVLSSHTVCQWAPELNFCCKLKRVVDFGYRYV